jgi:hypothetical protein
MDNAVSRAKDEHASKNNQANKPNTKLKNSQQARSSRM